MLDLPKMGTGVHERIGSTGAEADLKERPQAEDMSRFEEIVKYVKRPHFKKSHPKGRSDELSRCIGSV